MATLEKRLQALEAIKPQIGASPTVLPDDASEADLDRMRAAGVEAYRFADAVELFI